MRERTRISGSNLGVLASNEACRRCFWLMLLIGSKFPYRFGFPGVMFSLDKLEKNIVEAAIEHNGAAPDWMGDLASAEPVFSNKPLLCEHESGMTVTGIPDAVFLMPDNSLGLIDYKTARFRGPDDPLLIKYVVQLGVYTYLLEKTHEKKVSKAGLLYFQAEAGAEGAAWCANSPSLASGLTFPPTGFLSTSTATKAGRCSRKRTGWQPQVSYRPPPRDVITAQISHGLQSYSRASKNR
jgi:hypothetical protein